MSKHNLFFFYFNSLIDYVLNNGLNKLDPDLEHFEATNLCLRKSVNF